MLGAGCERPSWTRSPVLERAPRRHEPRRASADPPSLLRGARCRAARVLAASCRTPRPDRLRAGTPWLRGPRWWESSPTTWSGSRTARCGSTSARSGRPAGACFVSHSTSRRESSRSRSRWTRCITSSLIRPSFGGRAPRRAPRRGARGGDADRRASAPRSRRRPTRRAGPGSGCCGSCRGHGRARPCRVAPSPLRPARRARDPGFGRVDARLRLFAHISVVCLQPQEANDRGERQPCRIRWPATQAGECNDRETVRRNPCSGDRERRCRCILSPAHAMKVTNCHGGAGSQARRPGESHRGTWAIGKP